jgi:transcriptional regulator with XRE-family HTH domain
VLETTDKFHTTFTGLFEEQGWSQHSLSAASGVSQSLIGKYLRKEATPSLFNLDRIAKAMRRKPEIFVGSGDPGPELRAPMDVIHLLESCTSPQVSALRGLLQAFAPAGESTPKRRIVDLLPSLDDSQASFYLNMIEKELSAARGPSRAKSTIKTKKER